MKKLIFIFLLFFTCFIQAQDIGETTTPFDTTGWDAPEDTTIHYGLPIYRLLSNPGGWINISQRDIDSLLWALVVYTKLPLYIENDTLKFDTTGLGSILIQDASVTWAKLSTALQDTVLKQIVWTKLEQAIKDSIQSAGWYRLTQAVRDTIQKGVGWTKLEQAVKDSIAQAPFKGANLVHAFLEKAAGYTPVISVSSTFVKWTPTLTHIEKSNITVAGDTITIVSDGDYLIIMNFTFEGDANDDYTFQIRLNTSTVSTTSRFSGDGASEFQTVSMIYYFEGLVANDDISFYVTNTVDTQSPTFTNTDIYIKKEHD